MKLSLNGFGGWNSKTGLLQECIQCIANPVCLHQQHQHHCMPPLIDFAGILEP